ncbi:MAG: N-acetyltransferase family protein [Alphaproteobacteria bacterium]|nr:N-acetyltransferase family protein [Alphaproteobacteria bacterium]
MNAPAILRPAAAGDFARIAEIYGHHVAHGLASFEEVAPGAAELADRHAAIAQRGLPYLVAERAGLIIGYAYAGPYRPRSAYRYTVEDSVYLAPEAARRGIGRLLLGAVIAYCTERGYRQMVAVIGDSANTASIGLHKSQGFRLVGIVEGCGFKLGRWVDSVVMQRPLGPGNGAPPGSLRKIREPRLIH